MVKNMLRYGRELTDGICRASVKAFQQIQTGFFRLRWEFRLLIGFAAVGAVLCSAVWAVTSFIAYIRPVPRQVVSMQFGASSTYCDAWATGHDQYGKPTAGPCGVMLVGVNLSPSDSTPFTDDLYAPGNCTYWAALRRGQTGEAIPNTWGDAYEWAGRAEADGYTVDHIPTVGAIMQTSGGSLGHVAYVENVNANGTWHISEMNVVGLGVVDYRTMPASAAADYEFIH